MVGGGGGEGGRGGADADGGGGADKEIFRLVIVRNVEYEGMSVADMGMVGWGLLSIIHLASKEGIAGDGVLVCDEGPRTRGRWLLAVGLSGEGALGDERTRGRLLLLGGVGVSGVGDGGEAGSDGGEGG